MKDAEFIRSTTNKVPMTKEAVRILTLDYLNLAQAHSFIDVGAGTGSVCVEACVRFPHLNAIAIEKKPDAIALIEQNKAKFNTSRLFIIEDLAPCYIPISEADAIFIGGSGGSLANIIDWSYSLLRPNGRLVMNFILLNNLTDALTHLKNYPVNDLCVNEIQVSQLTGLGTGHYFKPKNPTFIISCSK